MRRIFGFFLISILSISTLIAQQDANDQLHRASQLEDQGQFSQVIGLVRPIMNSANLSTVDRGRAGMLLGTAYQQQGNFQDAARAYQQALSIFDNQSQFITDYAAALGAFATLYRDIGQPDAAMRMEERTLQLYEQIHNHQGMAVISESMAELAIGQKQLSTGRKYLARAIQESALAGNMNEDFHASILSTQAWLADFDHNYIAAVSDYRSSLDLLQHQHGKEHPNVGWGYMLLGKAELKSGNMAKALDDMREGLTILDRTAGKENIKYLFASFAFGEALDATGDHSQARQIKAMSKQALDTLYRRQCVQCQVSVAALH